MAADEPFELTASRIASLIGVAQSAETVVEVLAGMLLGERSRERLLTLLEAYKATCRLRLLRLQPAGSLVHSLPPQSGGAAGRHSLGGRSELSVRAGAPTALQDGGLARWPRASLRAGACSDTVAAAAAATAAGAPLSPAVLRLGEVLHIVAPVMHLLLVQLFPSPSAGAGSSRRAGARVWLPWLAALLLDSLALALCRAGTYAPPGYRPIGPAGRAELLVPWRLPAASFSSGNFDELRHRRCAVSSNESAASRGNLTLLSTNPKPNPKPNPNPNHEGLLFLLATPLTRALHLPTRSLVALFLLRPTSLVLLRRLLQALSPGRAHAPPPPVATPAARAVAVAAQWQNCWRSLSIGSVPARICSGSVSSASERSVILSLTPNSAHVKSTPLSTPYSARAGRRALSI